MIENTMFQIPELAHSYFPRHGWVSGTDGLKHLRLPILQLFSFNGPLFERFSSRGLGGMWLQFRSPHATLRRLALALRDLHEEIRVSVAIQVEDWIAKPPSPERDEALNRKSVADDRSEILITAAFILLRRLPDDIFRASGPLLFEKWGAAPQNMREMIKAAGSNSLERLLPTCDLSALSILLTASHPWFDNLSNQPGIRDTLVHFPHWFSVGHTGTQYPGEEIKWQASATLTTWSEKDGIRSHNILITLLECISGICGFMSEFCRCLTPNEKYTADFLFISGRDTDAVGFWPAIDGRVAPFPLYV